MCQTLGCYFFVALGPGEENANYLYLYLWSVCDKLLESDCGQWPLQSCHIPVLFVHSLVLCDGTASAFRITQ